MELGRGSKAFDIYRRSCPACLKEKSEIHETEPYWYSRMVTGRASGNLEWHSGYGDRCGLIYTDFPSVHRIPKDPFFWYQAVIRCGTTEFR